jgi:DNA-binding NarL/FixJ family response regulator
VSEVVRRCPDAEVVTFSSTADRELMSKAFQRGACGHVVHGGDGHDLPTAIWRALTGAYEADAAG